MNGTADREDNHSRSALGQMLTVTVPHTCVTGDRFDRCAPTMVEDAIPGGSLREGGASGIRRLEVALGVTGEKQRDWESLWGLRLLRRSQSEDDEGHGPARDNQTV